MAQLDHIAVPIFSQRIETCPKSEKLFCAPPSNTNFPKPLIKGKELIQYACVNPYITEIKSISCVCGFVGIYLPKVLKSQWKLIVQVWGKF